MAEDLKITKGSKKEKYQSLLPQIEALLHGESNTIANMANICAALKEQFGWLWIGFYLVDSEDELVLGPFQGPVACTRIQKGRGVCGTAWQENKTLIVDNVEEFPGHIACSSLSQSEVVIPFTMDGKIAGVLDVDSEMLANFDEVDKEYLIQILHFLD